MPTRMCCCLIRTTSTAGRSPARPRSSGPTACSSPYWLLNSEEISSVILGTRPQSQDSGAVCAILNELIPLAKTLLQRERYGALHITVDTPLPYG